VDAEPDHRPSLLIADDDAVLRSVLGFQLDGDFRVVAVAENAPDAIALAERHQPDAALLDVEMPGGGAREAVPQIAERSPHTSIVILSADESRDGVLELLSAGATAYLRKGVPGPEIAKILRDALQAKTDEPQE